MKLKNKLIYIYIKRTRKLKDKLNKLNKLKLNKNSILNIHLISKSSNQQLSFMVTA